MTSPLLGGTGARGGPPSIHLGARQTHKGGELPRDCQDAWWAGAHPPRVAVADGATRAFFAREWAWLVAEHFCRDGREGLAPDLLRADTSGQWRASLDGVRAAWRDAVRAIIDRARTRELLENRLQRRDPAVATLVGLELDEAGRAWRAVIIGDSCLLRFSRAGGFLGSHPVDDAEAFDNHPEALLSVPGSPRETEPRVQPELLRAEEVLVLATDAAAKWLLSIEPRRRFDAVMDLLGEDEAGFDARVAAARQGDYPGAPAMEDDDVTLVVVAVGPPFPGTRPLGEVLDALPPPLSHQRLGTGTPEPRADDVPATPAVPAPNVEIPFTPAPAGARELTPAAAFGPAIPTAEQLFRPGHSAIPVDAVPLTPRPGVLPGPAPAPSFGRVDRAAATADAQPVGAEFLAAIDAASRDDRATDAPPADVEPRVPDGAATAILPPPVETPSAREVSDAAAPDPPPPSTGDPANGVTAGGGVDGASAPPTDAEPTRAEDSAADDPHAPVELTHVIRKGHRHSGPTAPGGRRRRGMRAMANGLIDRVAGMEKRRLAMLMLAGWLFGLVMTVAALWPLRGDAEGTNAGQQASADSTAAGEAGIEQPSPAPTRPVVEPLPVGTEIYRERGDTTPLLELLNQVPARVTPMSDGRRQVEIDGWVAEAQNGKRYARAEEDGERVVIISPVRLRSRPEQMDGTVLDTVPAGTRFPAREVSPDSIRQGWLPIRISGERRP